MEHGSLSLRELAEVGRCNVLHTYAELGRAVPGARLEEEEHICICSAAMDLAFCNFAVLKDSHEHATVERYLPAVSSIARRMSAFKVFYLGGNGAASSGEVLRRRGFFVQHSMGQLITTALPRSAGVELREAVTPQERMSAASFMVGQFFWRHPGMLRQTIARGTANSVHRLFISGPTSQPDGAVMISQDESSLGIYNLCVRQSLRGRGLGGRIVCSILEMGVSLGMPVTLQCDSSLQEWYEELGFWRSGTVEVYAHHSPEHQL